MKTKIILSLFLFISLKLISQESQTYEFKFAVQLNECDALGVINANKEIINKGTDFYVEQILSSGDYVIHILKYKKISKTTGINGRLVYNADETRKFFLLPKSSFDSNSEIKYDIPEGSFTFGAITVPIKLRFGMKDNQGNRESYFDFTGDVNIGLSAGFKWRPTKTEDFSLNFLGGFSITSVEVDEQTTKGFVSTNTKASAFTPNLSIVFESKNFQIGVFSGIDFLSGELGDNWVYQDKPWLGIGLGYGIFSQDKKESTKTNQKKPE